MEKSEEQLNREAYEMIVTIQQGGDIYSLISKGYDVNTPFQGHLPLNEALCKRRYDDAKILIAHGADVNARDSENGAPIYWTQGNKEMLELLLNLGADINGTGGQYKQTVLFHADENTLKYLVEKGIDVNKQDKNGQTALMRYAREGNIEAVKYLVEHGADVNKQNVEGQNALNLVAHTYTGNFDTKYGETLKYLVDAGIDLNQQDRYGDTVLHLACFHDNTKLVKYLIDKGADVNKQNVEGQNALGRVQGYTNPQITKDLLEAGSNVNMQGKNRPLLVSIADGKYSDNALTNMKKLVEAGADINIQDQYSQTPLMRAVRMKNKDFVKYLCAARADLEIKDNSGKTAYDYANGKSEILGIMLNAKLEALQKAVALRAKQRGNR